MIDRFVACAFLGAAGLLVAAVATRQMWLAATACAVATAGAIVLLAEQWRVDRDAQWRVSSAAQWQKSATASREEDSDVRRS